MKLQLEEQKAISRHFPDDSHAQLRLPLDDDSYVLVNVETGTVIHYHRLSRQSARSRDITETAVGRILSAHWRDALQEAR